MIRWLLAHNLMRCSRATEGEPMNDTFDNETDFKQRAAGDGQ